MKLRLIPNVREVATKSISMWSTYIGIALVWLPDLIYLITEIDTNPHFWLIAATIVLVFGNLLGRVIDQSIAKIDPPMTGTKIRSSGAAAAALFLAFCFPLVAQWEGKSNAAYLDQIASPPVWTICFGQTAGVKKGDYMTDAECREDLEAGLLAYRSDLHRYFTPETIKNRLPAARDAAYVSLAWNVGIRGAGKSTAVRRLNAGDIIGGCQAISWWNKAGQRIVRGLVNRRTAEVALCLRGT